MSFWPPKNSSYAQCESGLRKVAPARKPCAFNEIRKASRRRLCWKGSDATRPTQRGSKLEASRDPPFCSHFLHRSVRLADSLALPPGWQYAHAHEPCDRGGRVPQPAGMAAGAAAARRAAASDEAAEAPTSQRESVRLSDTSRQTGAVIVQLARRRRRRSSTNRPANRLRFKQGERDAAQPAVVVLRRRATRWCPGRSPGRRRRGAAPFPARGHRAGLASCSGPYFGSVIRET